MALQSEMDCILFMIGYHLSIKSEESSEGSLGIKESETLSVMKWSLTTRQSILRGAVDRNTLANSGINRSGGCYVALPKVHLLP